MKNDVFAPVVKTLFIPEGNPGVQKVNEIRAVPKINNAEGNSQEITVTGEMDIHIYYSPISEPDREIPWRTIEFEDTEDFWDKEPDDQVLSRLESALRAGDDDEPENGESECLELNLNVPFTLAIGTEGLFQDHILRLEPSVHSTSWFVVSPKAVEFEAILKLAHQEELTHPGTENIKAVDLTDSTRAEETREDDEPHYEEKSRFESTNEDEQLRTENVKEVDAGTGPTRAEETREDDEAHKEKLRFESTKEDEQLRAENIKEIDAGTGPTRAETRQELEVHPEFSCSESTEEDKQQDNLIAEPVQKTIECVKTEETTNEITNISAEIKPNPSSVQVEENVQFSKTEESHPFQEAKAPQKFSDIFHVGKTKAGLFGKELEVKTKKCDQKIDQMQIKQATAEKQEYSGHRDILPRANAYYQMKFYRVQLGEDLDAIAYKLGVSKERIRELNSINEEEIKTGLLLSIPSGVG